MKEENILLKEISSISKTLKPKSKRQESKINYWLVALIIMVVLLISQTLQLSIIKAKISKGNFGASSVPASSNNNLPSMAGGC